MSVSVKKETFMNIGRENETIEFKRSVSETKEGIASISSMLNKHGKGILYFGVKDNGDVIGQEISKDTLNKMSNEISSNIKPSFYYEVNKRDTSDGKSFIEVQFYGDKTPYSAYGRYYLRFHDEDRQMDNDTLRNYYLSQRKDYSIWEKGSSNITVDKVDEDFLKKFIEEANERKRLTWKYTDKETALGKLGLLAEKGILNNAGCCLFSSEKPVQLKLAEFGTETRSLIVDLDIFNGNIFECINAAINYYASHINWKPVFTGNAQREDKPEIPMTAIREIIVNAFGHGDYNSNTDFELDIYKDRVSIYSPGQFPSLYTPEQFVSEGLKPIPMNVLINNVLYKNGTIEQFSTGFERTFEACRESGIEYSYRQTDTGFRFTFFRPKAQANKLNSTEEKVFAAINENNKATAKEMAGLLNVSERTVNRALKKLTELKYICREGSDKTGYWKVNL